MKISDKIIEVSKQSDFALWATSVASNNIPSLTRVSGFIVEEDKKHITFFLPMGLFDIISGPLLGQPNISLLMASLKDFESYQLKGQYVSSKPCTEKDVDFFRLKVLKVIDIINDMGMDGNGLFSFLLDQPSVAVTMTCTEMYLQTPQPGTGTKLKT